MKKMGILFPFAILVSERVDMLAGLYGMLHAIFALRRETHTDIFDCLSWGLLDITTTPIRPNGDITVSGCLVLSFPSQACSLWWKQGGIFMS